MTSLTAKQIQIATDAIVHMEGTDGSKHDYGPTKPGLGGGASALSYGRFQNDIGQGKNRYDTITSSQALFEMLDNYNNDPALDKQIIAYASTSAGAEQVRESTDSTDRSYNIEISGALSDPENISIWQAQDMADQNVVTDKLNEAINYINQKNPTGAGQLSWSDLHSDTLMALAAWTNQHPNIMPMIKTLTANTSSKAPLTLASLLDAIYQQRYFQGPKAYSSEVWGKRISDTIKYVNHMENDNFNDTNPVNWFFPFAYGDTLPNRTDLGYMPDAAWMIEPTPLIPTAARATAASDMSDIYTKPLADIGANPLDKLAPYWGMQPPHETASRQDHVSADGISAGAEQSPEIPSMADLAKAIAQLVLKRRGALQQPVEPQTGPRVPSGHPDDPVHIYPNGNWPTH